MAPFTLAPRDINDSHFVWNISAGAHWTYPGHHFDMQNWTAMVSRLTSAAFKYLSVVQETSAEGYQHTHVLAGFSARVKVTGVAKFDMNHYDANAPGGAHQLHPNFQAVTQKQAKHIYLCYHRGLKHNIQTGKAEYTPPVRLEQWCCDDFDWDKSIMIEVLRAGSLVDACLAAEVLPKSVMDVKALRDAAQHEPTPSVSKFHIATFKYFAELEQQVTWLYGTSGSGKSALAKAQPCKNFCLVKPFNGVAGLEMLKNKYQPGFHDLLILDEVDLRSFSRELVIALFDEDDDAVISVRFTSFELKKPVKIILLSNEPPEKLLPKGAENDLAIKRRFTRLPIYSPTWIQAPQPPQPFQPPRQLLGPGNTAQRQPAQRTPLAPLQTPMPPPRYGTPGV